MLQKQLESAGDVEIAVIPRGEEMMMMMMVVVVMGAESGSILKGKEKI